jgi:hypothetical protein
VESRFIEGWRAREQRDLDHARSRFLSAPRFVQILEDGQAVQYRNGQTVFIGRKTKVALSRGSDYEDFDALRRVARLKYITEWQQRFKAENPDRYKAQRKAIEERYRAKNRDAINNRQRLKRVQISSEKKAETLFRHAVYAQLVTLAGLRKKY